MNRAPFSHELSWILIAVLVMLGFQSPLEAARIFPSENGEGGEGTSSRRILPSEQGTDGSSSSKHILSGETEASNQSPPSATSRGERILPSESMEQPQSSVSSSEPSESATTPSSRDQSAERLIPTTEESISTESASTTPSEQVEENSTTTPRSPDVRYNPNTASVADLTEVPGLSSVLAERIEWYRREVGPFQDRNDLRKVPGIDRRIYRKISNYFHQGPYR